jgi:hypothetical protein
MSYDKTEYIESPSYGGSGGSSFDQISEKPIIGFFIGAGSLLDSIQPGFFI